MDRRKRPSGKVKARSKSARKPRGYWDDCANVERELRVFMDLEKEHIIPTEQKLRGKGRGDLAGAIRKHGGFPAVAKRLRLEPSTLNKPEGYWSDFTNVEKELRVFILEHSIGNAMPTKRDLTAAGYSSLAKAISKHGGMAVVAEQLDLKASYKPIHYWDEFANVEKELLTFATEFGKDGFMPTVAELTIARRIDLVRAIGRYGGFLVVAKRLGLERQDTDKPRGYWDDFGSVERELRTFITEHDMGYMMPTANELSARGRIDLARANPEYLASLSSRKAGITPSTPCSTTKVRKSFARFSKLSQ